MKKLLTLTAVVAMLAAPATAVQKCVALTPENLSCSIDESFVDVGMESDWRVNCTNNGKTIVVHGVNMCSNGWLGENRVTNGQLYVSPGTGCFCRIISPAVSKWVSAFKFSVTDSEMEDAWRCTDSCAYQCAYEFVNDQTFRQAMLSSL